LEATLHELSFESFKDLDNGKVPAAFNLHLSRILEDLKNRPFDDSDRKIVLTVSAKPEMDEAGMLSGTRIQCHVKSSVPQHKSKVYQLDMRQKRGQPTAVFSEVSNDGSPTLFDEKGGA